MAASLRSAFVRIFSQNLLSADCSMLSIRSVQRSNLFGIRTASRNVHTRRFSSLYRVGVYVGAGICAVGGVSALSYFTQSVLTSPLSAAKSVSPDQNANKPTKMVYFNKLLETFYLFLVVLYVQVFLAMATCRRACTLTVQAVTFL